MLTNPSLLILRIVPTRNLCTNQEPTDRNGELASVDLALLASLFDLAPDTAYFVKDAAGRYVLVNESLLLRHGLARKEDALGKRPCDILRR